MSSISAHGGGTADTGIARHLCVSALWFVLYAQWMSLVPIVVPDQIAGILGRDNPMLEGLAGSIVAAGAIVSLLVTPVAGAMSDRLRTANGRRRPFLIAGMAGASLGLLCLIPFRSGGDLWLYALVFMNLQLWWNVVAGPYAGLISDVVPARDQAMASAWMNIMLIAGTVAGNILVMQLYAPGAPAGTVLALIALNVAGLLVTVLGVREPSSAGAREPFALGPFLRSFWVDPKRHRNFYLVLISRTLNGMGIWAVLPFMLFYLEKILAVPNALQLQPILMGASALLSVPASLYAAKLSARHGLVRVVSIASWIMAVSGMCYVLATVSPSLWVIAPVVLVFGVSYGAFQAVDWALALKVLPSPDDAGKDMGIWHISMVAPQIVGSALTGWIISALTIVVSASFAYMFAFATAAVWFALGAWMVGRVRLVPER